MSATAPRSVSAVLSLVVSSRALYRVFTDAYGPAMYPFIHGRMWDERDGVVGLELKLEDGYRGCESFFHASRGALAGIPCYIGLRPADVEATVEPRGGHYLITLPDGDAPARLGVLPLANPLTKLVVDEFRTALREVVDAYRRVRLVERSVASPVVENRIELAQARWLLTARQVEVLHGLVDGLSTREIGGRLGCASRTVDAHVAELLKKADVSTRLQLVSSFWLDF